MKTPINRRRFLVSGTASAAALTIIPREVLGNASQPAPSGRIHLAYIGCGTQGLREMLPLLNTPEVRITAVCDPVKDGHEYIDWSKDGLRSSIAQALGNATWRKGQPGIPGGREVAKEIVETAYGKTRASETFHGCKAYRDFRELLENEPDLDAVKVMTPDHLHAFIAIAAMRKGKHVLMHKPLANRVEEARRVVETANQTGLTTHFLPANRGEQIQTIAAWIRHGAIGTLREIHNWSNRPVWPQYAIVPTDTPPVPKDFDWDLWLGPSLYRPYHPHYTHAVFRGWYEFGGGPIADMGHYSLWSVFREFELGVPTVVESTPSHVCTLRDQVSVTIPNDYSFPVASTVRFRFAARGNRPAVDLFWFDGGIKPPSPDELGSAELPAEGMMFVGTEGKIMAGFRGEDPRIVPESRAAAFRIDLVPSGPRDRTADWIAAFRGGEATYGDFRLAGPISEAFNLAAVSLRMGGKKLVWDPDKMTVTNYPEANKYLVREYRPGWKLG